MQRQVNIMFPDHKTSVNRSAENYFAEPAAALNKSLSFRYLNSDDFVIFLSEKAEIKYLITVMQYFQNVVQVL